MLPMRENFHQFKNPSLDLIGQFFQTTFTSNLPIIAALNGASPAGGCVLACCCDYRIMMNHPKFIIGLNEVKMGLAVPWPRILHCMYLFGLQLIKERLKIADSYVFKLHALNVMYPR